MTEADALEAELMEKAKKLAALRRAEPQVEIPDYALEILTGATRLSALFGEHDTLLAIHNMGQGCRYCTLWADGFNGILPHLEDTMAVVLMSKDDPATQRRLAQDRGWRFRMVSHGAGPYKTQQCEAPSAGYQPGAVIYERREGKIFRRARTGFGPGDLYSPIWHLLALAGVGFDDWTPQFHYWRRPQQMEDGGANLKD
jgi:predicted dithiol-disulfide oxidoreductase (DUF899 family)